MPCPANPSRRLPIPACSVLALALVIAIPAVATDTGSQDWLPLEIGSSWVYQDEAGERLTIRVQGRADGAQGEALGECYRVTWNDELLGPAYQAEVWCREGGEVRLAGKELSGSALPMAGAAVLLREPLAPGAEWDSTFSLGGEELVARGVVVGRESVSTPSGDYDAMHVRIEQPSGDVDRWYARGVGIVQEETSLFGRSLGRKSLSRYVSTSAPETVALFDAPAEPLQPQPQQEPASSGELDEGITSATLTDDSEPLFPEESDHDSARFEATEVVAEPLRPAPETSGRNDNGVSSHPEFDVERQSAPEVSELEEIEDPQPPVRATSPTPEPFAVADSVPREPEPSVAVEGARTAEPRSRQLSEPELELEEISDADPASGTRWTTHEAPPAAQEGCDIVGSYLVMSGGEVVDTEDGWERDGRRVLYRNHAGALLALRTSSVDFEETERRQRADCERQAERERVKPPPPPRNWLEAAQRRPDEAVALELADGDLGQAARERRGGSATSDAVHVLLQMGVDTGVLIGLDQGGELASLESVLRQQQSDLQARLNPYRDRIDEGPAMSAAVADEVLLTARQLSGLAERENRGPLKDAYEKIGSELERAATRMRSDPLEATRLLALLSG